jgi:hypothetical protein
VVCDVPTRNGPDDLVVRVVDDQRGHADCRKADGG